LKVDDAEPQTLKCDVCSKQFRSKNAMDNHLQSRKHRDVLAKQAKGGIKKNIQSEPQKTAQVCASHFDED